VYFEALFDRNCTVTMKIDWLLGKEKTFIGEVDKPKEKLSGTSVERPPSSKALVTLQVHPFSLVFKKESLLLRCLSYLVHLKLQATLISFISKSRIEKD
jgi:hypothetical protein